MKPIFAALILLLTLLAAPAQTAIHSRPTPPPGATNSTLQVSLTTAGYQFNLVHYFNFTNLIVDPTNPIVLPLVAAAGAPTPVAPPAPVITPLGFNAAFALKNNTSAPLAVSFPWAYWATNKIVFTVYDASDAVVWTSTPIPVDVPPLVTPVILNLGVGQCWSQNVFVPLVLAGAALPSGNYRLEATVTGTPAFTADAAFAVQNLYAGVVLDPPVTPAVR